MFALKNVKVHNGLSHETYCFTATLYYKGKKVAVASNRGCGGQTDFDWVNREIGQECLMSAQATDLTYPYGATELLGSMVDQMVGEHNAKQSLKRIMRQKTLFRKPNETYGEGEYSSVLEKFSPKIKDYLVRKYGSEVFILNEQGA